MNKKGNILIIYSIILTTIFFAVAVSIIAFNISIKNNECLKLKAIEYCNENNLYFDNLGWGFKPIFFCEESERTYNSGKLFKFLESELKECEW